MENEEMTNDAAVAWVVVDQTLRKDSPDPNFMNGAYWTSFETVSADRALSVVKERQSIRPTGEYEVIALVPATTVAELRAEVVKLREILVATTNPYGSPNLLAKQVGAAETYRTAAINANQRADAAERRVAELEAVLGAVVADPTWRTNDNTLWPRLANALRQEKPK